MLLEDSGYENTQHGYNHICHLDGRDAYNETVLAQNEINIIPNLMTTTLSKRCKFRDIRLDSKPSST